MRIARRIQPWQKYRTGSRKKIEKGDLGRKTGQEIYTWDDGQPKKDKEAEADVDLTDRLVLPMVNAGMALLSEKVIEDEELLDTAMIFGTGFAPFRGVPMSYVQQRGIDDICATLQELAKQHGDRFQAYGARRRHQ